MLECFAALRFVTYGVLPLTSDRPFLLDFHFKALAFCQVLVPMEKQNRGFQRRQQQKGRNEFSEKASGVWTLLE